MKHKSLAERRLTHLFSECHSVSAHKSLLNLFDPTQEDEEEEDNSVIFSYLPMQRSKSLFYFHVAARITSQFKSFYLLVLQTLKKFYIYIS